MLEVVLMEKLTSMLKNILRKENLIYQIIILKILICLLIIKSRLIILSLFESAHSSIYPVLPKNKKIFQWNIEKPIQRINKTDDEEKINKIIEEIYNKIKKKIEDWIKKH